MWNWIEINNLEYTAMFCFGAIVASIINITTFIFY